MRFIATDNVFYRHIRESICIHEQEYNKIEPCDI